MKSAIAPECKDKMLINDDFVYDSCYLFEHNYNSKSIKENYKTVGPYVVHGDIRDRPWIMCLGGSTTSEIQGSQWCRLLYKKLESKGVKACIFNGGCASHNSWNEPNKLMRDLPTYKPDIVISLSGINDFTIHVDDKNPCINTRVLEDIMDLKVFNGLNIPKTALDHATLFIERSKQMNSICNVYNTKFYRFLQPTLGFGNYIYDLSDPYDTVFKRINDGNDSYHAVERLKTYYSKIINLIDIEKCSYIYNLTHIFDGKSRLFKDFRHPNTQGYEIISQNIVEVIS